MAVAEQLPHAALTNAAACKIIQVHHDGAKPQASLSILMTTDAKSMEVGTLAVADAVMSFSDAKCVAAPAAACMRSLSEKRFRLQGLSVDREICMG